MAAEHEGVSEGPPSAEDDGDALFRRRQAGDAPPSRGVEIVSAVLLSVTVILTAWSAFESSKWGGAMAISFSQASSSRIQANRAAVEAAEAKQIDLTVYTQWFQAKANQNEEAADYVAARFTDRLQVAFDEWVGLGGISDPANAPPSPFALESYVVPGTAEIAALDARADSKFEQALRDNQRGDNYTILGVLFAVVLFFAAMATRFTNRNVQIGMLTFAGVAFVVGAAFLASFPKLI